MTVTARPDLLTAFGTDILISWGVPDDDARLVSDSLVTSDLWGHPSHGMLRLPWYVARLRSGEATVTELARPFAMSQPAISKHLKVLERAGLIVRGRDAQRRPCRLQAEPLKAATEARYAAKGQ